MGLWSRRTVLHSGAGALLSAVVGRRACAAATPPSSSLHFGDLERFEALVAGGGPERIAADYLRTPSPGLTAYLAAYRVTPEAYRDRLAERPRFYASLIGLRVRLRPFEAATEQGMVRLRSLFPGVPAVPVYFLVGTLGPGATVKEVAPAPDASGLGILMPAELLGMTRETDLSEFPEGRAGRARVEDVAGYVAHEYGHVVQVHHQGLARYRALYTVPGRATNLALAVREGAAELLSWLATGQTRERHHYFRAHEAELRREFGAIASGRAADSRGWFSGANERQPDRPVQLGYALGLDMCRQFLDRAPDRSAALCAIVSAAEPADFAAIAGPYLDS
jgi:hypothetical protein